MHMAMETKDFDGDSDLGLMKVQEGFLAKTVECKQKLFTDLYYKSQAEWKKTKPIDKKGYK